MLGGAMDPAETRKRRSSADPRGDIELLYMCSNTGTRVWVDQA
jgi:hypothetical protein